MTNLGFLKFPYLGEERSILHPFMVGPEDPSYTEITNHFPQGISFISI